MVFARALEGVKVRDIMTRPVITVRESNTVSEAVDNYFFKYHHASYPVTSNGHVAGLLTLSDVRSVDKEKWNVTRVSDVMDRLGPGDALNPEDNAMDALAKMTGDHIGRFPVLNKDGGLEGILSMRDIMKVLEFKTGLQK